MKKILFIIGALIGIYLYFGIKGIILSIVGIFIIIDLLNDDESDYDLMDELITNPLFDWYSLNVWHKNDT